jgi:hypothetical protein
MVLKPTRFRYAPAVGLALRWAKQWQATSKGAGTCYYKFDAKNSRKTSGCLATIFNSVSAAPEG